MVVFNAESLENINLTKDRFERQEFGREFIEFQTLVENTKVMMLIFQENRICYANPMTKLLTGYTKEELLVHTDLVQQLKLKPEKQVSDPCGHIVPQYQQVNLLTKNGKQCWLDCSIRVVQLVRKPAIFVTAIDITKHKEAEMKIEQILEQEKKLVSMVSHELRTPLNVISFSSRLLNRYSDRWKPAKVREYLERLQRGVDTLSLLIDEWLILGKVETGKLKFEPKSLNIAQFCRNLLSDLQLCDRNRQQINFLNQGDCSSMSVDPRILSLILTNLLENAIKYSPDSSEIDFVLSCNSEQVAFKIKDKGIGIKKSDLNKLFEPFYRGKNVDNIPGHGLGLAVVKKLVELHGGQISVESQLRVGTEFIVILPTINLNVA